MNSYLIAGIVLTIAGVLLGVYDKVKGEGKENRGFPLPDLSKYPPPPMPECKPPRVDPIKEEPWIDDKGYARKMVWTSVNSSCGIESTGGMVIDEEHEITIKRRALDKLHHQGMLGQGIPKYRCTHLLREFSLKDHTSRCVRCREVIHEKYSTLQK